MTILGKLNFGALWVTIFLLWGFNSICQGPPEGVGYQSNDYQSSFNIPDSTIIDYYTIGDIKNVQAFSDTLLQDFEKYLEHRTFEKGALTLGNFGSASQPIMYKSRKSIVTDIGFHQYDIYKKSISEFPVYVANRTFNDLSFSSLGGSQNLFARAKFTRTYKNDINFSIDYNRIAQEGFYQQQNTKATQLGVCFSKTSKSKKHRFLIGFAANNFNETHNGGIQDTINLDSIIWNAGQARAQRTSVPVQTGRTPGQTRQQNFSYSIDNYFYLDSNRYAIHHQLNIEHGYYRFGDDATTTDYDTTLYKSFLVDQRGIRFINKFNRIINQFDLGLTVKSFDINVGINYNLLTNDNSIESEQYHDIILLGKIDFNIGKFSQFSGIAELGVGENAGNIKLMPQLNLQPIKNINIKGYANILRYDPSILHREAYVTNQLIYNNDFSKINEFALGGSAEIKKINLKLEFESAVITNPISYNNEALPIQKDGSTEYIQAKLQHKIFWKFIGLENSIAYQEFTDNVYQLPKLYSIHNIYLQSYLFKRRLLGQVGLLFYNYEYDGYSEFMPVTGQFFPTERTIRKYYYTELYGNFKVDQFRIFFKMENLTDLMRKEPHYQIVNYPQYDAKFRMGIRWQLFD